MSLQLTLGLLLGSRGSSGPAKYRQPVSRVLHGSSVTAGSLQSNAKIPHVNNLGRAIVPSDIVEFYYLNLSYTASAEFNPTSTLAVRSALEYPSGTRTATTTDGTNRDVSITGAGISTLKVTGLSIPNGAIFWEHVRAIASGGDGGMAVAYTGKAALNGGTIQCEVITPNGSDYTTVGGIPTNPSNKGYGCYAISVYSVLSKSKSFLILGDSIARGFAGVGASPYEDGIVTAGYTYLNCAASGGQIATSVNFNPVKRMALAQACGCTEVMVGYPTNDIGAGSPNATILANLTTLWTNLKSAGFSKIIQSTCTPKTVDATSPGTPFATPTGAYTGGASSLRSQHNATLRGLTLGGADRPDIIHDLADVYETARDSGLWTNPTVNTTDGLHPSVAGGGVGSADTASKLPTWGYT